MNGTEGETVIVFLGLGNLAGILSLAVLLFARRIGAAPRPRPDGAPQLVPAAAETGSAAAGAPSPPGSAPLPRPQLRQGL